MHRDERVERVRMALHGERCDPPVAGLSFVPDGAWPGLRGASALSPARAMSRTCAEAGLDFAFVSITAPDAAARIEALREVGVAALAVCDGVLWAALRELGVEAGLRASVLRPAALAAPLQAARDAAAAQVALAASLRADGVVIADDLAGAGGPLVTPALLTAEVLPRLASAAREASVPLPPVLHSDGDMRGLVRAVAAAGFAGLHGDLGGADRIADTLADARRVPLAILGGIPTAALASPGRAAAAGAAAGILARGGGLLLADDGGIEEGAQTAAALGALAMARSGPGGDA